MIVLTDTAGSAALVISITRPPKLRERRIRIKPWSHFPSALSPQRRCPIASFLVAGHTDDVPIHNARLPSNWELSTDR